ncbi:MAG TPA: VOC family protein [Chloroflexota bacterium]|jgi:methylmalonyl-CoA/ethylmalonyl-CoA epimerase
MVKAKLRHVAICTEDPAKVAAWYQELFGLVEEGRTGTGGVYLSDGDTNFAVLRCRPEGDSSVQTPGVSHFGFVVDDPEAVYAKLTAMGAERLPTVPLGNQYFEVKFVGPDGVVVDVGEHGWVGARGLEAASEGPARAKLRHVAISTEDPARTAAWYKEVFGLEEAGLSPSGIYLTDGDTNFAVLRIRTKTDPPRTELGMSHFGFLVEDPAASYRQLEAMGVQRLPDIPLGNQYYEAKFRGPDGVTVDVGEHGWVGARGILPRAGAVT